MALAAKEGTNLDDAAQKLRRTRPTAVNLAWAVDQALRADNPLDTALRLHREQREADVRLAELGAEH